LIRIDMSEFMEKHNISRLVGAPPGYIAYQEGGELTEKIRRKPYSVILLDEIEKAHPEVFNILLQILDRGRLTDAKGRVVNFKNSIVIMTSNIGSQYMQKMAEFGFTKSGEAKKRIEIQRDRVLDALKDHFKPEFLNRLDEVVVFNGLGPREVIGIVDLQLDMVAKRLADQKIKITISDAAKKILAKRGFDPQFGARPLKRAIQQMILDPLAKLMVEGKVQSGAKVKVDVVNKEISIKIPKPRTLKKVAVAV